MAAAALSVAVIRPAPVKAQIPIINIVTSAIKKVIVAIDIKVQQLQNQTIQLQNAEQALENSKTMTSLKDISGWLGKEKDLFHNYYEELQKVRQVISDYRQVKLIISQQAQLVSEYRSAWALFQQDKNFTPAEIAYMSSVYSGLLDESLRDLSTLTAAVSSFTTQMSDGERLQLIRSAAGHMQQNLNDLRQFNSAGVRLSLQRSLARGNNAQVRQLYGLTAN